MPWHGFPGISTEALLRRDADLRLSSGQPCWSKKCVKFSCWCQTSKFLYNAKMLGVDYVFVDEHNRHKRLKGILSILFLKSTPAKIQLVMRACEGCRRRKIKCDAASTNTWPCSACTRLKLHCIPPTGGNDRDYTGTGSVADSDEPVEYSIPQSRGVNAMHSQPHPSLQYAHLPTISTTESAAPYARSDIPYHLSPYPYSPDGFRDQYLVHDQGPFPTSNPTLQGPQPYYPHQPPAQVRNDSTVSSSDSEHTVAQDLSEALGELKIAEIGIGKSVISAGFATTDSSSSTLYKTTREERDRA